ncbi:MAG: ATP-binding protein [Paludibacteraceae bacterium]|nr:ATP-binding protein [Paludibacteraceae bacterium]
MDTLFEKHDRIIEITPMEIIRQWANSINWDARLLAIRGPKGVGKSTIMRQYIKQHYKYMDRQVLYVSCDDSYFSTHTILDLVKQFYLQGGKHLFIDEIHKYDNWSQEIKEAYDFYPTLRIAISGSSLLSLTEGDSDLSRRCINHDIQGLSFREFLHFYKGIEMPIYPLEEVLTDPAPLIRQMNSLGRPVALFHEYMKYGYYPYYMENEIDYYQAIQQVVNQTIDNELTKICHVSQSNTRKIKALMTMLCASEPFEVDITKMSILSGLKRDTVVEYLMHMGKAKLLQLLYCDLVSVKRMQKPDKIYIDNPNMLYAWATTPVQIGTVRETIVVNQLTAKHDVEFGKKRGDFLVDRKYTIEVGGENKNFRQIKDIPNSYVLADNLETAIGNKLPIWSVGFLY